MRLRGKTALVTGAAKRLGREISLALGDEGANVIVHYGTSAGEAAQLCEELKKRGVNSWALQSDFERGGESGLIGKALSLAGGLDMLVNNASVFPRSTLAGATFDGLMKNMRVNAWAPFELCRDFARLVKKGKIINMLDSRVSGYDWTHVEYLLSKTVFSAMTRMMAVEFAPDVTVNGIAPGLILPPPGKDDSYLDKMTGTVPMKKHGSPKDIAEAAIYLLKSDFVTGEVLNVDGGRHLIEYDHGPHFD